MGWVHPIIFLGVPIAGVLLTGAYIIVRPLLHRHLPLPKVRGTLLAAEGVDTTQGDFRELPQELKHASSHSIVLAENWLDRPCFLGGSSGAVVWLLIGFGAMLVVNLTLLFIERDPRLIPSMMAKTLCIGLIPIAVVYSKQLLAEWLTCLVHFVELEPAKALEWFARHIRSVFLARSTTIWGLLVGLFILLFEYQDGAFGQRTLFGRGITVLASLAMTSLAGVALTIMVKAAILVSKVGRLPIYVSASPYGLLSTGNMLVKTFGAATGVYVVAVLTMVLRTGSRPTPPIVLWALFVAALYLGMFLFPQWTIHESMVAFKRHRLIQTENQLRIHLAEFDKTPNKATNDMIQALRHRRDELQSLPDWPFNWKNFTSILGLAFSSTIPMIFKILVPAVVVWLTPPK